MTLEEVCADLILGNISLISGVIAQLTRTSYLTPYTNEVNYQQFVPILYLNIVENSLLISNTSTIKFSTNDIFVASDWTVLNELPTP